MARRKQVQKNQSANQPATTQGKPSEEREKLNALPTLRTTKAQAKMLSDTRLPVVQRRALADQIRGTNGNRHLSQNIPFLIQRYDDDEYAGMTSSEAPMSVAVPVEETQSENTRTSAGMTSGEAPMSIEAPSPTNDAVSDPHHDRQHHRRPTMNRNRRPSLGERRQLQSQAMQEQQEQDRVSRERMAEVMMDWHRGDLIFNFKTPNGRVVRERMVSWIEGSSEFILRTDDPEVVLDWIIRLSSHFILYKLYPLQETIPIDSAYFHLIDEFIERWEMVENLAQSASTDNAEEFANAYQRFKIENEHVVHIIDLHFPEAAQAQTRRTSTPQNALTEVEIAELRQAASQFNYSQFYQFYTELNEWLEENPAFSYFKTSIETMDALAEQIFGEERSRLPRGDMFDRLKLLSKIISIKGYVDKIMLYVGLDDRIQGAQDRVRFNAFFRYWQENGWSDLIEEYNVLSSSDTINISESSYLTLDPQAQVELGLRIGRVFELHWNVQHAVMMAGVQEARSIFLTSIWNMFDLLVLSRIPAWAIIKLALNTTVDGIRMIANGFAAASSSS